jgi:hypothetical protein
MLNSEIRHVIFFILYLAVTFSLVQILSSLLAPWRSRVSVVGIATGYGQDDWGVGVSSPPYGQEFFIWGVGLIKKGKHNGSLKVAVQGPDLLAHPSYIYTYIQDREFSVLHVIQKGSGVDPTSYPMGTRGFFPEGKAAGAWSWPLTSSYCRGQENMDLYICYPIHLHGVVLN